ncbi:vacuolar sorting protein [Thelephora ganbajun]|uniref:Vacuolar sorting protein n=1 Tax=Thelephora ganbajun TaxID=370292 RepID=A0ACB6ZU43_THEGA|nr:vacuolar sorting protein [Thelephora ganbajun]
MSHEQQGRKSSPRQSYSGKAKDFIDLHDQVQERFRSPPSPIPNPQADVGSHQTGLNLLDSLESFLSTFQRDLGAVSGQISDLQDRSKQLDSKLKSRRKIERPLSSLITDICLPPSLITTILDTDVSDAWIPSIGELEQHLDTLQARGRVKAAKDMVELMAQVQLVVCSPQAFSQSSSPHSPPNKATGKIRAFFMAILKPIKSSMTTNMQVIQTSVLLKYRPLYTFLQRRAPNVALEFQKSYIAAARVYYETGFRRYTRSLSWIKARTVEKSESLVSSEATPPFDLSRLEHARIDGPGIALAYMGDNNNYKAPLESLLRSALLVLMDNTTAEYTFVTTFFPPDASSVPVRKEAPMSPSIVHESLSPVVPDDESGIPAGTLSATTSTSLATPVTVDTNSNPAPIYSLARGATPQPNLPMQLSKEDQVAFNSVWKQITDPAVEYTQTFVKSCMEPIPPIIPLLTMIRLTEDVVNETQRRGCAPLETVLFTIRLQMWPAFQKAVSEHVEQLKKYADGVSSSGSIGGFFGRGVSTTDASVVTICKRYVTIFEAFVTLTAQEEETMIFSNLLRLRQELSKLILKHTEKIEDPVARSTTQGRFYELLLNGLSNGSRPSAHPKTQTEIAYWREREEELRRRMASTNRGRK